ncbi:MAG: cupredoxin domain-containing protein [Gemmatimonadaceae bacterium]|nr:cupredoxin domain-containing protein [Gemmatimonadaceae bacterium]NUO96077.1 cupredoxin domain-containing protein [Gemmatimonadaceae bacterium]NUP54280.1 cupredoxin domain-containing protein [Gemmatimonadaceae bacterium]NUP71246.1 cupredoxin domain-containing protein [Gemmatimonadaceae bacterium]NUR36065.1 cupredoxin domain-containing protein [Gemmatimonadaceae bacterium]
MSLTDWFVIAAGLAAGAWVNWYFFLAERNAVQALAVGAAGATGAQQVDIVIHGAYSPATIRVAAGRPVRLVFDRQETSSCSEEVVFPAFGVRKFLPAHEKTAVEITPPAPGTYDFTCGMGMLHGRLIAE